MKCRLRRRAIRWGIGLIVAAFVLAAALPYAFPPKPQVQVTAAAKMESSVSEGDRATLLVTGEEALAARLNLIANAQTSLEVGTYLYADDESGHTIAAALLNAADRGVRVRIVTDGLVGKANLMGGNLGYVLGTHPNIELRFYNPVNLLRPWELSARYHEKYVIADDRIFVLGGRNISDEFLTAHGHPSYNYDMDVLVYRDAPAEGSAAAALTAYFDNLWDERCKPQFEGVPAGRRKGIETLTANLHARYEQLCIEYAGAIAPIDWTERTAPIEGFALLSNPTNPSVKQPTLWAELIGLMKGAERRVWVQTPYLVLDGRMRDDLAAVAGQTADMMVLTNSRAGGNNIVASADAVFHKPMYARLPMELYEFQGDASMHTKTLLIDDELCVVGSFNFDMRSAYSDTELMLAIRSKPLAAQLEAHMLDMRSRSLPLVDGRYGTNGDTQALTIPWTKNLLIYAASPILSLVRYLL